MPIVFDTKGAGEILGVTSRHVTELCRSGKLKGKRLSFGWVIEPNELKKYRAPKLGRPHKECWRCEGSGIEFDGETGRGRDCPDCNK